MASINYAQIPLSGPISGYSGGEEILRWQERQKERVRIARELHDSLFQGFISASMVLHRAVEEMPSDSPSRHSLALALNMMHRVLDEGRSALQSLRSSAATLNSLEELLSGLRQELVMGSEVEFRVLVSGRSRSLDPVTSEQLHLIAREAVANAVRHSGATQIEVDLEYAGRRVTLTVRDNGCGMDHPEVGHEQDGHWGLLGMRERAEALGGQLRIWSRRGAGTEVQISVQPRVESLQQSRPVA